MGDPNADSDNPVLKEEQNAQVCVPCFLIITGTLSLTHRKDPLKQIMYSGLTIENIFVGWKRI